MPPFIFKPDKLKIHNIYFLNADWVIYRNVLLEITWLPACLHFSFSFLLFNFKIIFSPQEDDLYNHATWWLTKTELIFFPLLIEQEVANLSRKWADCLPASPGDVLLTNFTLFAYKTQFGQQNCTNWLIHLLNCLNPNAFRLAIAGYSISAISLASMKFINQEWTEK